MYFPQGFCEIELGFPDLKSMLFNFQSQSILEIRNESDGLKLYPSNSCHPVLEIECNTVEENVESDEEELNKVQLLN